MRLLSRSLALVLILCSQHLAQMPADLIIVNAKLRTLDKNGRVAEAVAVSGNKISAVGTTLAISGMAGPNTRTIDAGGRIVLPGFNDSHVHFTAIGNIFSSVDLSKVWSPEELSREIELITKVMPPGRWILGRGWNEQNWTPATSPTKALIDSISPQNPVLVYNADGRSVLVNSVALAMVPIRSLSATAADVERDAQGEPTGILRGRAIDVLSRKIPQPHVQQWPDLIRTASNYAASLGVTSVQDVHSDELWDIYRQLDASGELKTRVYDCAPLSSWRKLANDGVQAASRDPMVRTGCLKHYSDGDKISIRELFEDISGADKAGLQVMIHAMGPAANDEILTIFERVIAKNGPRDRRFRIEHVYRARAVDLPRFARSKIIASMQPWLFYQPGRRDSAFRTLLASGAQMAFGSDASMTDLNPLLGIYAAVESGLTVDQAVRAYTVSPAFAEFQESVKGTIELGKLADIVMLSDNIFSIAPRKIRETRVILTIVGGRIVYQADEPR